MKKIFATLAVVLMSAVAANAQLLIGGSLGMGGNAPTIVKEEGKLISKTAGNFNFDINPKVGYLLLDRKLEVGMAINMGYYRASKSYMVIENKAYTNALSDRSFTLEFVPYAKYDFFEKNGFSLGVLGELGLGAEFALADHAYAIKDIRTEEQAKTLNEAAEKAAKDAPIPFSWGITIAPVVSYMPTEHIRLEAALTGLSFNVAGRVVNQEVGGKKYNTSSARANLGMLNGASYVHVGCAYVF